MIAKNDPFPELGDIELLDQADAIAWRIIKDDNSVSAKHYAEAIMAYHGFLRHRWDAIKRKCKYVEAAERAGITAVFTAMADASFTRDDDTA